MYTLSEIQNENSQKKLINVFIYLRKQWEKDFHVTSNNKNIVQFISEQAFMNNT